MEMTAQDYRRQRSQTRGENARLVGRIVLQLSLTALLALILMQAAFPRLASAEVPPVTVEVVPQSAELPSEDGAKALVMVQNASPDITLQNVKLTFFTYHDLDVELLDEQSVEVEELAPESVHEWTLRVEASGEGPVTGVVHFRVDYGWTGEGKTRESTQTVFKQLQTTSRLASLDSVANVEAKTSLGSGTVSRHRPGTVYLIVRNLSNAPLRLKNIMPKGPEDMINFSCDKTNVISEDCAISDNGVPIEPYERRTVAVNVATTERVTPGKYVLLFELPMEWGWPGARQDGDLLASQEVTVEVFGESNLLTIFGVNVGVLTLFLLPGAMAIAMWGLLWNFFPMRSAPATFPLGTLNPSTYIVAIVLSPIIVGTYALIARSNLYRSYGTEDLVWLAVISLLLFGIGVYFLTFAIVRLVRRRGPASGHPQTTSQHRSSERSD